jgi:hypothetical protein
MVKLPKLKFKQFIFKLPISINPERVRRNIVKHL